MDVVEFIAVSLFLLVVTAMRSMSNIPGCLKRLGDIKSDASKIMVWRMRGGRSRPVESK